MNDMSMFLQDHISDHKQHRWMSTSTRRFPCEPAKVPAVQRSPSQVPKMIHSRWGATKKVAWRHGNQRHRWQSHLCLVRFRCTNRLFVVEDHLNSSVVTSKDLVLSPKDRYTSCKFTVYVMNPILEVVDHL